MHDRWYHMDEGDLEDSGIARAYAQKLREHHAALREKVGISGVASVDVSGS